MSNAQRDDDSRHELTAATPSRMQAGPSLPALGLTCASSAYFIWGLAPIYWKALRHVPVFEILMHRIIWSLAFLAVVLVAQRRWRELLRACGDRRAMAFLAASTIVLALNWFLFIWAVNTDRVLQTSLGYFLNPLVNVLLGVVFLRERLGRAELIAVAMACIGVLNLLLFYGRLPWLSIALALSFASYGLLRKLAPIGALIGLAVEVMLLSIPALAVIAVLESRGAGSWGRSNVQTTLLLASSWSVTAFPLWLFVVGARRLRFLTIGFLQYVSPSCTFLLAVFLWKEPLGGPRLASFVLIWIALAIYSIGMFRKGSVLANAVARDSSGRRTTS